MRSRALVAAFAVMAVAVLAGGYALVRAAASALRGPEPGKPVEVAVRVAARGSSLHVVETLSGTGLRGLTPDLNPKDIGYVKDATTRTTGRDLDYRGQSYVVAPDGRSATLTYDVDGTVAYVAPVSTAVQVVKLTVEVDGRLASCLLQYGTNNGTPRLRPCHPSSTSPLVLTPGDNSLERVRIEVVAA